MAVAYFRSSVKCRGRDTVSDVLGTHSTVHADQRGVSAAGRCACALCMSKSSVYVLT